jgi:hypothetical protein
LPPSSFSRVFLRARPVENLPARIENFLHHHQPKGFLFSLLTLQICIIC